MIQSALVGATLLALGGGALGCQSGNGGVVHAATVGAPMPRVTLQAADGSAQDVDALRAGKPALVTFWATWCDACKKEFEALNRLDERAKSKDAMVIGVAVGESSAVAGPFAKGHDLRYVMLFDEEFKLADALGQRQVPATVVLDRKGNIVFSGAALDEAAIAAFGRAMEQP